MLPTPELDRTSLGRFIAPPLSVPMNWTKRCWRRGKALEAAGYHQQVKVTSSSVLLFTLREGARTPIHRSGNGEAVEFVIGADAAAEKISSTGIAKIASSRSQNSSARTSCCDQSFRIICYQRSHTLEERRKLLISHRPQPYMRLCWAA